MSDTPFVCATVLISSVKYVALLAFNRIVTTHPFLVAQQEDVIMDCIDSPDISIRFRALDLVVGMVSSDNLMSIVGRLMRQLRNPASKQPMAIDQHRGMVEPAADSDDEAPEVAIKSANGSFEEPLLPDDYKLDVINRILQMCSSNNYGNMVDFDWYIDILIQLVRTAPVTAQTSSNLQSDQSLTDGGISKRIGDELRNVAVKVKAIRPQAARAAESILILAFRENSSHLSSSSGALKPVCWTVGEYASHLESPEDTLTALVQITKSTTSADTLMIYLQALPKIFALLAGDEQIPWTLERKTMISLLMARINNALEPLAMHPDLEVQERAVEFSELMKLAAEAVSGQDAASEESPSDAPLLLTQAIPSLFIGQELNSVAAGAQKNVPVPSGLDLDQPINANLSYLLRAVESFTSDEPDEDEFAAYYHVPLPAASTSSISGPAIIRLGPAEESVQSYQQAGEESYLDPDILERRRAERRERNKDDPFYIAPDSGGSGTSTPLHNILRSNNGQDFDVDSIPIMQLDLGKPSLGLSQGKRAPVTKIRQRIQVAVDENLAMSGTSTPQNGDSENSGDGPSRSRSKAKQSLLQVDSSHIGAFSLEGDSDGAVDFERQQKEEAEMAKAMKEVERLRLEMQRANERIQASQDAVVVKKKVKKAKPAEMEGELVVKKKRPKKKPVVEEGEGEALSMVVEPVRPKKKKKKAKVEEVVAVS